MQLLTARGLARVERATLDLGRRFIRDRLQNVLNTQADDLEKRGSITTALNEP